MENKFKFSGWALSLFGAFNVLLSLFSYSFIANTLSPLEGYRLTFFVLANFYIALCFLAFLCGVYLIKNNEAVHKLALPVSFAIMIAVPIGTIVGALYLWQRNENT